MVTMKVFTCKDIEYSCMLIINISMLLFLFHRVLIELYFQFRYINRRVNLGIRRPKWMRSTRISNMLTILPYLDQSNLQDLR